MTPSSDGLRAILGRLAGSLGVCGGVSAVSWGIVRGVLESAWAGSPLGFDVADFQLVFVKLYEH